jgi:hypothetical protein
MEGELSWGISAFKKGSGTLRLRRTPNVGCSDVRQDTVHLQRDQVVLDDPSFILLTVEINRHL